MDSCAREILISTLLFCQWARQWSCKTFDHDDVVKDVNIHACVLAGAAASVSSRNIRRPPSKRTKEASYVSVLLRTDDFRLQPSLHKNFALSCLQSLAEVLSAKAQVVDLGVVSAG